jgi:hypothetical protein
MNPYQKLPETAFWKPAVAQRSMYDITGLWNPKFEISASSKVATYGSCFAQHIGNALEARGFNWLIEEKPPSCNNKLKLKKFGYNIFSARTGNIYTTSLLRQWVGWVLKEDPIPVPQEFWEKDGRFYDPFRPAIEPNGFESREELLISREVTLAAFRNSIVNADVFVFTLGLVESWFNQEGYEYPICPGTLAGEFDEQNHKFKNQSFSMVLDNLRESIALIKQLNPEIKFILTVSPVPLTATMSGKHVAVATMAAKSTLRAVAEEMSATNDYIDYFPSYEIINSPIFLGTFFEPNKRTVNPFGVKFVMNSFFECLNDKYQVIEKLESVVKPDNFVTDNVIDEHCEEALLEAFSGSR